MSGIINNETGGSISAGSDRIPTVLIVEDDEHYRDRLAREIENSTQLHLLAVAGTVADGRHFLDKYKPDVLLADLDLPDGSGITLIRQACLCGTESMVLSVFGDEKNVVNALHAGASGYMLKDCDTLQIGSSIVQLIAGGSPISPTIARHVLRLFNQARLDAPETASTTIPQDAADSFGLTQREHEVLQLIAKGYTYQEIADVLHLSIHTVTSHIKHIYRKLAVGSRGEAVYEAGQIGLI